MTTATIATRISEGTLSAQRLQEAIRSGEIRMIPSAHSITADPYLLNGPPAHFKPQTARQQRALLAKINQVEQASIPAEFDLQAEANRLGAMHFSQPAANDPAPEPYMAIDRNTRSRVWHAIGFACTVGAASVAWLIFKA